MKLGIVVPCYNEAVRLDQKAYVDFLRSEGDSLCLCFVNDGSRDGTSGVLEKMKQRAPGLLIVDRQQNRGKAESVREGILKLLTDTDCEWVGFWDADLATPLSEIAFFRRAIAEHPQSAIVMGARILRLGAKIVRHWYRHYTGRIFATFASLALGLPVYDTQCGAKVIRRDLALQIFREPFLSRWLFDVELLFRIQATAQFAQVGTNLIYELPLNEWVDVAGSRVRPGDFLKAPFELWKIRRHYKP
ncbi:MAG: glycosyltransferase [Bdellovibrionales bacterium]|nr:glycosyltransferase [Bdellovibrionales bacterium]